MNDKSGTWMKRRTQVVGRSLNGLIMTLAIGFVLGLGQSASAQQCAPGSCVGSCATGDAPSGCYCDDLCCGFDDCCHDKFTVCGGCDPLCDVTTCAGSCGGVLPECSCDEWCEEFEDCCDDFCEVCPTINPNFCDPPPPAGCDGFCGEQSSDGCWCDGQCASFSDCCDDFCDHCPGQDPDFCGVVPEAGCENACGGHAPAGCWCDALCPSFTDCCEDFCEHCEHVHPSFCDGSDPGAGIEDCSVGFWKNLPAAWSGYAPDDLFGDAFPGTGLIFGTTTLDDALNSPAGGPKAIHPSRHACNLARHAVAALLNSMRFAYPMSESEVKSAVIAAFAAWSDGASHDVLNDLKDELEAANNAICGG